MSPSRMVFPRDRTVLLSDVIKETRWLEIQCKQCGRAGRLSVCRLIAENGATATAWSIVEGLTEHCPQKAPNLHWTEACKVICPTLAKYSAPSPPHTPRAWAGKPR